MSEAAPVIHIASAGIAARICSLGAELVALTDARDRDFLWNGDPAVWGHHAPLLFPIVGQVAGDRIRIDGRTYPMSRHGFARDRVFAIQHHADDRCVMTLRADAATLAHYPFRFRLEVSYRCAGAALSISAALYNEDARAMPASFGFHPAFVWPLPDAGARLTHVIEFDRPESAPIRRLAGGLLTDQRIDTPVVDRRLRLDDALFENDALVFDQLSSRRVVYRAAQGPAIAVAFADMPQLGVWTKPGARFVCIEPWRGFASPAAFDGEFRDKPGIVSVAPGDVARFEMTIEILD